MKKKLSHVIAVILSFALAGAVLTGCGEGRQSGQEAQQNSSESIRQEAQQGSSQSAPRETRTAAVTDEAKTETSGKADQITAGYEDNFAVDKKAAKEFAEKVKAAAADKDLEALAALTAFPVYVGLPDVNVVETKEEFLKLGAETVFTEELLKSVANADIDDFEPSMAGFSISDGGTANINFGVADGALAINGINY